MLRPASQVRIIVACAEFDQAGTALEIASCILLRVGDLLRFMQDDAIRVVVVGVDLAAAAVRQPDNRAQPMLGSTVRVEGLRVLPLVLSDVMLVRFQWAS